jgi:hypothetical protein
MAMVVMVVVIMDFGGWDKKTTISFSIVDGKTYCALNNGAK